MTQKNARHAAAPGRAAKPTAAPAKAAVRHGSKPVPKKKAAKSGLMNQFKKRPLPVWIVIVADLLIFAIALLVFALFHHVIPSEKEAVGLVSQRSAAEIVETAAPEATPEPEAQPQATETPQPSAEAIATPDPVGYFGSIYTNKFVTGEPVVKEDQYISSNIRVTMRSFEEFDSNVFFADIYIKDISCLQTAFGKGKYGKNLAEETKDIARDHDAIVAVNGDFYGMREDGVVIRNGMLYRADSHPDRDVCVIYWDGRMEIFPAGEFDAEAEIANGAYQAWNFGPNLLSDSGTALSDIRSSVSEINPRAAIGYFKPGHYAFVVVDGRSKYSEGVTLDQLSSLMASIGCQKAYNLDGGASASLFYGNSNYNRPSNGGREVSDIIMIVEPEA